MAGRLTSLSKMQFVLLICLGLSTPAVYGQHSRYVQPIYPTLNATSWHGTFPVRARCVSIRYAGIRTGGMSGSQNFNALGNVQYTVIGSNGVRFETRKGLFEFFEEEPDGKYTVISNSVRLDYKHNPNSENWSEDLTRVIDGGK